MSSAAKDRDPTHNLGVPETTSRAPEEIVPVTASMAGRTATSQSQEAVSSSTTPIHTPSSSPSRSSSSSASSSSSSSSFSSSSLFVVQHIRRLLAEDDEEAVVSAFFGLCEQKTRLSPEHRRELQSALEASWRYRNNDTLFQVLQYSEAIDTADSDRPVSSRDCHRVDTFGAKPGSSGDRGGHGACEHSSVERYDPHVRVAEIEAQCRQYQCSYARYQTLWTNLDATLHTVRGGGRNSEDEAGVFATSIDEALSFRSLLDASMSTVRHFAFLCERAIDTVDLHVRLGRRDAPDLSAYQLDTMRVAFRTIVAGVDKAEARITATRAKLSPRAPTPTPSRELAFSRAVSDYERDRPKSSAPTDSYVTECVGGRSRHPIPSSLVRIIDLANEGHDAAQVWIATKLSEENAAVLACAPKTTNFASTLSGASRIGSPTVVSLSSSPPTIPSQSITSTTTTTTTTTSQSSSDAIITPSASMPTH